VKEQKKKRRKKEKKCLFLSFLFSPSRPYCAGRIGKKKKGEKKKGERIQEKRELFPRFLPRDKRKEKKKGQEAPISFVSTGKRLRGKQCGGEKRRGKGKKRTTKHPVFCIDHLDVSAEEREKDVLGEGKKKKGKGGRGSIFQQFS